VDLVEPPEIPQGCTFIAMDVLNLRCSKGSRIWRYDKPHCELGEFDFICASSPCEKFSVHGMKHFHPNPPYPELGIKLFNHTREICEASGVPYVMENVRAAQQFVGQAVHHCGPFYLWGKGVPPLLHQGKFAKGMRFMPGNVYKSNGFDKLPIELRRKVRTNYQIEKVNADGGKRRNVTARTATIPPELANCVADYAERLLEMKARTQPEHIPCVVPQSY